MLVDYSSVFINTFGKLGDALQVPKIFLLTGGYTFFTGFPYNNLSLLRLLFDETIFTTSRFIIAHIFVYNIFR